MSNNYLIPEEIEDEFREEINNYSIPEEIVDEFREETYGIAQEIILKGKYKETEYLTEYAMWEGPHQSLATMKLCDGRNEHSVIVRFNPDHSDDVIYRWEYVPVNTNLSMWQWVGVKKDKVPTYGWIPIEDRMPKLWLAGSGCKTSKGLWLTDGERIVDGHYYDCTNRTDRAELVEAKIPFVDDKGFHCYGMNKKTITHWRPQILPDGREV